ncbi:SOS response-associated peptidase family protein [Candidatus Pantoea floridensis]|uniref:Abasic site processing protein n=1 Tax=Candidatus Pantoea floridensis TaxID=1938870 RepID=A0A286DSN1_9GAMM|nr:SOS response-associated peptidase family protein [Pantoea floridensis]PIF06775.1 putative SOS response-associated peptidase YedK [Enterobacteriaceae bacterium JKS000233]SOD61645.1 Putative SOS response-associated peptidase YedK [Pantoea floridensis]
MCGRFAQYSSRDEYFESLGLKPDELTFDPDPIGRFNVAPGTKVLLLSEREHALHFDPVYWGYGPEWWDKQPLINARGETAASGRMFKPLWNHGRAIVPANGWFEWKKEDGKKQPFYIYHRKEQPLFFAAIGRQPFGQDHGKEGFVIVTSSSNKGMVDIHDRRPLVITADAVREWLSNDTSPQRAEEIAHDAAVPEQEFTWHPVSKKVGNIHNQGKELIEPDK